MSRIKIINKSPFPLPEFKTSGSSGRDLQAHIAEPICLVPMERELIPTGLFLEIPMGMEAQVRPRSGLAIKEGLTVINTPGTIDADYRGELKVGVINLSTNVVTIRPGDRIAQLVFAKIEPTEWEPVKEVSETTRGEGGFGHTGKQ